MNPRRPAVDSVKGFTLVELVIVITLTGIVVVLVSTMVGRQMLGYVDTARRADMMGKLDIALEQVTRDLRNAAPYSIRISSGTAVEWVPIESWGRYRKLPDADPDAVLDFSKPDDRFEVLYGNAMPAIPAGARILIGNTDAMGVDGINVYGDPSGGSLVPAGSNVITPDTVTVTRSGNDLLLSPAFQFSLASLASRFYVVTGAVSYVCSGGAIHRYGPYGIQNTQPTNAGVAPLSTASDALLVDGLSSCQFGYSAIDSQRGQLSVSLTLQDGGDSVTSTHIINIENRP